MHFLGIADPSYRTDFQTLHRILLEMAPMGGLFAECGVYRGATLLGMAHTLRSAVARPFRIVGFDSFEGFPPPVREDALPNGQYHERAGEGVFGDTSLQVVQRCIDALGFADQITLVKGYFEDTLDKWCDQTFSVVHLDCDLYQSYVTCLDFFYPRMRPGGYMVFDEYDFAADVYPGAQKAIDGFLADKPERIQRFPDLSNPRFFIIKQ
jgi:O-methyltransferase